LAALFISEDHKNDIDNTMDVNAGIAYLPWRSAQFVYHSVQPFFDDDIYSISILKGLITSSGGLTESSLKESLKSLFEYLNQLSKVEVDGKVDKAAGI